MKVEFISDDYLMLLASTGQPSFYPQDTTDDEYDNIKSKIDDNNNFDTVSGKSETDDNNEDEKEGKIFDFH